MLDQAIFAVRYAVKGFEALVLKQKEKIDKGDIMDLKMSDVSLIKELFPDYPESCKTDELVATYNMICENFPDA